VRIDSTLRHLSTTCDPRSRAISTFVCRWSYLMTCAISLVLEQVFRGEELQNCWGSKMIRLTKCCLGFRILATSDYWLRPDGCGPPLQDILLLQVTGAFCRFLFYMSVFFESSHLKDSLSMLRWKWKHKRSSTFISFVTFWPKLRVNMPGTIWKVYGRCRVSYRSWFEDFHEIFSCFFVICVRDRQGQTTLFEVVPAKPFLD